MTSVPTRPERTDWKALLREAADAITAEDWDGCACSDSDEPSLLDCSSLEHRQLRADYIATRSAALRAAADRVTETIGFLRHGEGCLIEEHQNSTVPHYRRPSDD